VFLKYSFAFLKHGSLWSYRLATWTVLAAGVLFVSGVLVLRYWLLPNVDELRGPIAQTLAEAVGQPVAIARLEGSWRGYRPELRLHGLKVMDTDGQPALELERVDAVLSWVALFLGKLSFYSIEFDGATIELRRDSTGKFWVAGSPVEPRSAGGRGGGFADWLLSQRQVVVLKAKVSWLDELRGSPLLVVEDASLRLDNEADVHRFGLTGVPPTSLSAPLSVRGELIGESVADATGWSGRLYGEFDNADLAQAQSWIWLPIRVNSGLGTLRLWLEVAGGRIVAATADANLANTHAQLSEGLEPLAMRNLSGRTTWRLEPGGFRVAGDRVSFTTAEDVALPEVDIEFRRRGTQSELSLDGLELAPVVELAEHLPLDPVIREHLAATTPSGRINGAKVQWQGTWGPDQPYSVQADLESLRWNPLGLLPGASGISGRLNANQGSGMLSLRASGGSLRLPRVFEETIPLDFLSAEVDWQQREGRVLVNVRSAAFTNDHAAGNVSGSYASDPGGKGSAYFSGRLVRADARAAWRYIPRFAPKTQHWLKRALVSGVAEDVQFRLEGPLDRFPFKDGAGGRFEVVSKVTDVTLAYDEKWPVVEGVGGVVAFRGASMEIESAAGRIYGIEVGGTRAAIPILGNRDEHLILEGRGSGSLPDFLRLIQSSPVAGYTNRITEKMRATGEGRLRISLDIPLRRSREVKLAGSFDFTSPELRVDARIPALSQAAATVEFSEKSATVRNGRALLYGSPFNFTAGARPEGGVLVAIDGRIDGPALQQASDSLLARHIDGATDWKGTLAVRDGISTLRVESSLAGMALRMPPPLAKPADTQLAFKLELIDQPGSAGQVSARLANLATARITVERGEISRGEIRFGGEAVLPSRQGLALAGRLEQVDVDAWRQWSRASGGSGSLLSSVDLFAARVALAGRQFHSVRINGEREAGTWRLGLDAREAAGTIIWQDGESSRLEARLSTLVIPQSEPELRPLEGKATPRESLPGLDLIAESFMFEGKNLGRLELLARPAADSWQLEKLAVSNPDGRLDVTGKWLMTEPPTTELAVRIEAGDAGKLMARLGYDEGLIGAKGSLAGPVKWAGSPYRPDLPSLSGQLRLEASKGRFAKLEPGVGKLLGILSLQSIPRRLSLDFRDLFSSGFSFDRISADVVVVGGVAQTTNFRMDGSAARVEMSGQVDLAAETQELKVRVLPQLSTGVAIAGAVVNPAVGVATLLAQKALGDPVERLAAQDYHVSGTWAEPRVERASQKVETASPRR